MPKDLHIRNKVVAVHGKSIGSGLFMRSFNNAAKSATHKAEQFGKAVNSAAVDASVAANEGLNVLHTRTAKQLKVFKRKAAQKIADSSPAAGLSTGSGLMLSDQSIKPRFLNEKAKPNIRFHID